MLLSRLPAGGARGQLEVIGAPRRPWAKVLRHPGPQLSGPQPPRPPLPYSDSVGKPTLRLLYASLPSWSTEGRREGRRAGNPHLCTPVHSPGLDSLAPETTSPERPEGPWSPPHLWRRLGRPCSSLFLPEAAKPA